MSGEWLCMEMVCGWNWTELGWCVCADDNVTCFFAELISLSDLVIKSL